MTHLLPIFRPEYGQDNCDFINLEGEFEFRADLSHDEVYETLSERAEIIGGLCTKAGENTLQVYPWNGPGSFLLRFPASDESVSQIDVLDRDGEVEEEYPIEQMKERGRAAEVGVKALEKHMSAPDESEPNWVDGEPENRYRIDFDSGELVPVDGDSNAEE